MNGKFPLFQQKLLDDGASALLIESFRRGYQHDDPGTISENSFQPLDTILSLDEISSYREAGRNALSRVVIIKLNGGLGTSMGLDRAKSLIEVREGLSFLDIIARQVLHMNQTHGVHIPIVFMNSYSTREDTLEALVPYDNLRSNIPLDFLQHRVPKIEADTFEPVRWSPDTDLEWCPPGHGDIYPALQTSGLLDVLLETGKEFAFVSNSDNLGAVLDLNILGYMSSNHVPFIMEVTQRTASDRKGGHLARLKTGELILRELAQCPEDELDAFRDIERYRYFNTNNLWIHLPSLQSLLEAHQGVLPLPVIRNRKTVDPADPTSTQVVQLETAMGSAIALFGKAQAVHVPRTRFAPVKTTDDLLALWSDAYELTPEYHVRLHPFRNGKPVNISLDREHFVFLHQMRERFPQGVPSLLECSSLRIDGDVRFGVSVVCRGDVSINGFGHIPDGSVLTGPVQMGSS